MRQGFQAEEKPCGLLRKLSSSQMTRTWYTVYARPWWETRRHIRLDFQTRITVLIKLDIVA